MLSPKNEVIEMRFTLLLKIGENQTKYVNQLFSRQWSGKNCDPWLVWKKWGVHLDCLSFTPSRGFSGPNPERIYAEPENSLRWWKQGVSSLKTRMQYRKRLQRERIPEVSTKSFSCIQPRTDAIRLCEGVIWDWKEKHRRE